MKTLIAFLLLLPFVCRADFDENSHRYMSPRQVILALQAFDLNLPQPDCTSVTDDNASVLGASSVLTGNAISPGPTQATVQFITTCLHQALNQSSVSYSTQLLGGDWNMASYVSMHPSFSWSTYMTEENKKTLIKDLVLSFLGPDEVIQDFGLIQNPDWFREQLYQATLVRKDATVAEVIEFLVTNLAVRDEFLSY